MRDRMIVLHPLRLIWPLSIVILQLCPCRAAEKLDYVMDLLRLHDPMYV
jgi:hypothetical protein